MKVTCPECNHEFEVSQFGGIETPVRNARRDLNLTLAQVAEAIDISIHSLRELERGKMNPRLSTMRALGKLYGKSMDELFPVVEDEETEETVEA